MNQKIKAVLGFLVSGAVLTAIDQWTKSLAVAGLKGKEPFVIWKGVFELLYSENRGAAFGVLQGKHGFFFLVAACVFVAALYVIWKLPDEKKFVPLRICITLITAGAAGNLIDRVVQGYVVDFLYFILIDFPIFNVADCYVTVSVVLLIILILFVYKEDDFGFLKLSKKGDNNE